MRPAELEDDRRDPARKIRGRRQSPGAFEGPATGFGAGLMKPSGTIAAGLKSVNGESCSQKQESYSQSGDDMLYADSMRDPLPVLIADESVLNLRFLRETLSGFLHGDIDTSSNAEYAFELALKKDYGLFVFGLGLPKLPGELLYDLLRRISKSRIGSSELPPVLFLGDDKSISRVDVSALVREPGVRGILRTPLRIHRLMEQVAHCVEDHYLKPHVWEPTKLRVESRAA